MRVVVHPLGKHEADLQLAVARMVQDDLGMEGVDDASEYADHTLHLPAFAFDACRNSRQHDGLREIYPFALHISAVGSPIRVGDVEAERGI